MVKGKGKRARQTRNLLLRMSGDKHEGPSLMLKQWKDKKQRVKVKIIKKKYLDELKFNSIV